MSIKYPKVLILQNEISSYNISTYNLISQSVELTVGYFEIDKSSKGCSFEKHKLDVREIGPFVLVKGLRQYCKKFDLVCILPNLRYPSYCLLPFLPHKYKVVSWGIGFRCSYTHPYLTNRKHTVLDSLYQRLLAKCDANIFYMDKSKEFWADTSLKMDNVFVAPNTTDIENIPFEPDNKVDFIFVGTLYKGKGLDILLQTYQEYIKYPGANSKLIIVGGGELETELKSFVNENGLDDSVIFTGPIYDEALLATYFQRSLLCFSPAQAGLSVPKSMGYGVPFVTRKDAITGGELYHISNEINGLLYSDDKELKSIMVDSIANRERYLRLGRNAKDYYDQKATVLHKAKGAIDAFSFALNIDL